jgi:hypothetical protein
MVAFFCVISDVANNHLCTVSVCATQRPCSSTWAVHIVRLTIASLGENHVEYHWSSIQINKAAQNNRMYLYDDDSKPLPKIQA